jgi:hypothetical protein
MADHSRLRRPSLGQPATAPVGLAGFEPATSCTQSTRASQAALQPADKRMVADPGPWPGSVNRPARWVQSQVDRRSRLVSDRWRLPASRRSRAPRLGRVGRRGAGGGAVASMSRVDNLLIAACRLRSCDRCSDAAIVITPPVSRPARAFSARSLSTGGSDVVAARSKDSSTRLSAVLTDCPPGPGDLEKRQDSSSGGITTPRTWTENATTR